MLAKIWIVVSSGGAGELTDRELIVVGECHLKVGAVEDERHKQTKVPVLWIESDHRCVSQPLSAEATLWLRLVEASNVVSVPWSKSNADDLALWRRGTVDPGEYVIKQMLISRKKGSGPL